MTDLRERKQLVRERRSGLPKKAGPASGMKSNPKRVNPRSVSHANGSGQKADDGAVRLVAGIPWSLQFYGIAEIQYQLDVPIWQNGWGGNLRSLADDSPVGRNDPFQARPGSHSS